jgi:superkiller protein 3
MESEKANVQAALNLCLEAAGKAERAGDAALQEKALRECVKLCFDQPRAHYALGRFLCDRGQYDASLKAFKQAIILDPKFALAQLGLADAAIKAGEVDAALVAIKQAIQLEPGNPDASWSLAELYDRELQNKDKAAQMYRQFADRFPGDPRVIKAQERLNEIAPPPVRRAPPTAPVVQAPAAAPAPRPTAQPTGRLRIKPTMVRNTHAAVQAYNRGTLYQQQEDLDRAIYYYTRAVENDDTFATAFFNLGSVYWAKGEYGMAKDAYARTIQLEPDMIAARYNLALISRELKEKSAAIEQLGILLKDHPDYAPGHYLLGMLYADDPATVGLAKEQYKAFLELAPNDPAAPVVRNWVQAH